MPLIKNVLSLFSRLKEYSFGSKHKIKIDVALSNKLRNNYKKILLSNNNFTLLSKMKTKLIIALLTIIVIANAQNTWIQKPFFGGDLRSGAAAFSIGSKAYVLLGSNTSLKNDLWEYDTLTNAWTQKADFPGAAREQAVAFSIGDSGYVGTGMDWSGNLMKDFWQYIPSTDTWVQKADFAGTGRYSAVGFSINNKGYIGTGTDGNNQNDFWEYNTGTNSWTQKAYFIGLERYGAVGFSIGNKGYIGGGFYTGSNSNQDFYEYNPSNDTWVNKATIILYGTNYASGFSIGSKGYILSGNAGAGSNFAQYDPANNEWIMLANLPTTRDHAVGFSIGNNGYIATGQNGSGKRKDFWKYTQCASSPAVTITPSGATTFCQGGSVTLTASNGISYAWSTNESTQSITVNTSGTYSVILTDSCGVVFSSPVTVTVQACTGISELTDNNSITFSPNPFSEETILHSTISLKDASLTIYNSLGQQVSQVNNISGNSISLRRNGLPNGVYLIRIIQDNKSYNISRIVLTDN